MRGPAVAAFTPEPVGVAMGCPPTAAAALVADALDLHHRLPLLWDHTVAGILPAWKARRVATRTRHLSLEAARWVDRQLASRASSLSSTALDRLVAEASARVDGEALSDRETADRARWDVTLIHPDPSHGAGTSEIHATGDTLDLTRFHDVVCAEADALDALGDTDTFEVRKAKALGVIADTQARLDVTSLLGSDRDPAAHEAARRAAIQRRDAKVRLHLHASLADVIAGAEMLSGRSRASARSPSGLIRDWVQSGRARITPAVHVAADDRWSVDAHDPPPRTVDEVVLRAELRLPMVQQTRTPVRPRPSRGVRAP